MKKTFLIIFLFCAIITNSQSEKPVDKRPLLEKEDSNNLYKQSKITTLDLLEALELASVRIHKFQIGTFNKEYKLQIFADEYINGKLIKSDTLLYPNVS